MIIKIENCFDKDVGKIKNKRVLNEVKNFIQVIEKINSIHELSNIKKIEGYKSYYRIRVGDYRLGFEKISNKEIKLIRFLHRKEIYRYFPP